jgi:hypothetical protein
VAQFSTGGVTLSSAEAEFVAASQAAKKPSICGRCCGVSISDKLAPQKYWKIMHLAL